jgi:hypothetical protein
VSILSGLTIGRDEVDQARLDIILIAETALMTLTYPVSTAIFNRNGILVDEEGETASKLQNNCVVGALLYRLTTV